MPHSRELGDARRAFDTVVNPRLIDVFDLEFTQETVDFAIPRLKLDIPLAVDPFLLWKSKDPSYQDLHRRLLQFFERVRVDALAGRDIAAMRRLLGCREPRELGLGFAQNSKHGSTIGPKLAQDIIDTFRAVPQLQDRSLDHIEVLALLVSNIAEDRIGDIAVAVLKSYFVEYTADRARALAVPTEEVPIDGVYDGRADDWTHIRATLPFNPSDGSPLLFAPLNMLRHLPWINYEGYYASPFARLVLPSDARGRVPKPNVLARNRQNYVAVERYVKDREREAPKCLPDPTFRPLKPTTIRAKIGKLIKLNTGRDNGADKQYEGIATEILTTVLFPELKFADTQVRTEDGSHIRDLIFYNDGRVGFLDDLRTQHNSIQIVFELKNVATLEPKHVDQLYRYLTPNNNFGKLGVLVSRNAPPRAVRQNIIDLHSSKRCVILCLSDNDLDEMSRAYSNGDSSLSHLARRYTAFMRSLPT